MNRSRTTTTLIATAVLLTGCYNARVNTGLTPSDQVIEEAWAASWIYGAVSPETVEVASECPNGVAQVHTYHSFLNMLVAGLTGGIFTPMTIKVTCAARGMSLTGPDAADGVRIDRNAPMDEQVEQFEEAVDLARSTGEPLLVRF